MILHHPCHRLIISYIISLYVVLTFISVYSLHELYLGVFAFNYLLVLHIFCVFFFGSKFCYLGKNYQIQVMGLYLVFLIMMQLQVAQQKVVYVSAFRNDLFIHSTSLSCSENVISVICFCPSVYLEKETLLFGNNAVMDVHVVQMLYVQKV